MKEETKREKFIRLAENRVNSIQITINNLKRQLNILDPDSPEYNAVQS